jgi:hypothetical protein
LENIDILTGDPNDFCTLGPLWTSLRDEKGIRREDSPSNKISFTLGKKQWFFIFQTSLNSPKGRKMH